MSQPRSAVVFGARNLGLTIIESLRADSWSVAGAARSAETLERVEAAGALGLSADVTDPASVAETLRAAAEANGPVGLAVNAASPAGGERQGPFGGGPIIDADPAAFDAWATPAARGAFAFLSAAGRFTVDQGRPATLIQVTGGSTRRAMSGRGLWAAGAFAVRAMTNAAALELRPEQIHVALLIVDAVIQRPGAEGFGEEGDARADPRRIADAVLFLADQDSLSATHELQLTPLAESWTP